MDKSENLVDGKYSFADLVDIERLEAVSKGISLATGIAIGVTSYPEQKLLIGNDWQDICSKFHRGTPQAEKVCIESNKELTGELNDSKNIRIKECAHGLIDGATPIIIKGTHVANLFSGQIFFEEPDLDRFREGAKEFGFEEEAYLEALKKVPIIPKAKFIESMTFVSEIALILAEQGLQNLRNLQLAKEAQETSTLLRAVVEQSNVPMLLVTLPSGKVKLFNKACLDFHGISEQKAEGKNLDEIEWTFKHYDTDGNLIARDELPLMRALRGEARRSIELRVEFEDGTSRYCLTDATPIKDDEGNIVGGLVVFPDITDRKEAEQALRESETRFRELAEMLPETVFEADLKLNITYANQRSYSLFGFTEEDFIKGVNGLEMIVPQDRERAQGNLHRRLKGEEVSAIEYTGMKKDGTTFPLLLHMEPIIRSGAIAGFRGIIIDMTDRKELEAQYLQAQKVESIGRLAGGVAHDLNNLLTPILGYGELLRDQFASNDSRRDTLMEIIESGKRARNLVRQLLAFSRKQKMEFKSLNLNGAVSGFARLLRHTIREDIEIKVSLPPKPLFVMADIGQVEQVIMNLAINSSDAISGPGQLCITTSLEGLNEDVAAQYPEISPGLYAMLQIADTGCGMDNETMEKVFEPFFTTKGDRGTGLGLATVYGIVKQHDGHVLVESKLERGTTFKILLPVTEEECLEGDEGAKETQAADGMGTVLLVEDNEQVRQLARAMLTHMGYEIKEAANGQAMLDELADYEGPAHILLTDVIMPGMNGKELYAKVKEIYPSIGVVYMSGYTAEIIGQHGVLDGKEQLIDKPFSYEVLSTKLREALEG